VARTPITRAIAHGPIPFIVPLRIPAVLDIAGSEW
jgi:hypothetical protein